MSFQTLYIGISPFNGPSIYNIIPMIELIYGVWFIKGGMFQYAKALEKRFIELGGQIVYQAEVQEIAVSDQKHVTGLKINEEFKTADAVVANADFPYTMTNLLGVADKAKGKYKQEKIEKMDYSMSCFLLYLGVDKKYDELRLHTIKMARALMSRLWTGFFGTERYRTLKIFQNPDFSLKRRDFWVCL